MDKSPKYIRMSDTPFIQDKWKPEVGDVVAYRNISLVDMIDRFSKKHEKHGFGIWLPRQDQSQGMIEWKKYIIDIKWDDHPHKFMWRGPYITGELWLWEGVKGDSMEQLWLAFVMHTLHQLTWDDEKGWVEEVK
ncbi:hypothetical protein LCGC14_2391510 [marine sediment metagenome]|uniref:Uncharacterized protein n=1 Tax=marine sediment metagenome TaxID=412755 RepID=A0A0F9EAD8_9ZZZZ